MAGKVLVKTEKTKRIVGELFLNYSVKEKELQAMMEYLANRYQKEVNEPLIGEYHFL